jgi:hypothetical protein
MSRKDAVKSTTKKKKATYKDVPRFPSVVYGYEKPMVRNYKAVTKVIVTELALKMKKMLEL